ncbi:hypothetical protein VTP01DRAFT_7104 [Rhizomucor pusillus]|uniref:uncharacterized protein n=1 Tax=Rhizomucor pusillus TaxID=4840 RepID=UPI003742A559
MFCKMQDCAERRRSYCVIPNSPSCTREKTEGKPVKEERTRNARNRAAYQHALELCKQKFTVQGVWSVQV